MKFYYQIIQQIEILNDNGYIHGSLNPNFIIPFSNDDGVIILDSFKSLYKQNFIEDYKYSSPQVIQNSRPAKKEDDIWSIGMILLEMSLGVIPFDINEYFCLNKEMIEKALDEKKFSQKLKGIIINLLINRKVTEKEVEGKVNQKNRHKFRINWQNSIFEKNRIEKILLNSNTVYN